MTRAAIARGLGISASTITKILGKDQRGAGLLVATAIERATMDWRGGPIRIEEWARAA